MLRSRGALQRRPRRFPKPRTSRMTQNTLHRPCRWSGCGGGLRREGETVRPQNLRRSGSPGGREAAGTAPPAAPPSFSRSLTPLPGRGAGEGFDWSALPPISNQPANQQLVAGLPRVGGSCGASPVAQLGKPSSERV